MRNDEKVKEQQIRDSEDSFDTPTDFNNDCVFLFDSDLNCIDISKSALQLFPGGTRKKDVIGKHLLDIAPGIKEVGRYERYVEVLNTGMPISEAITVGGPKFADVGLSVNIYQVNDGLGIAVNFSNNSGDLGQIAKEIREAEERYRGLVEGINDIVYVLDDKAVVTYVSSAIESVVGYSTSDIVGRNISEYIYPEDLLLVIQKFQSGSFANIPGPFEFRLLTKSGEVRWVRNFPRTLIRENQLIGYQGVLSDITDSKRAEEDLKRSEQQFRALIENATDAIVVINPDATVRYESPSMEKLLGRKARSRIGKNALEFCHPDDVLKVLEVFAQLVEGKIPLAHMEIHLRHRNGKWITFELVGTNLIDDPIVAGIVLNMRDISERKEAEERLLESEIKHRTLIDSMADVIIQFDLNGKCTYCSPQVFDIIGYKSEEVIGWHMSERMHPEDRTMVLEMMEEAYVSGEVLTAEFRLQHKDGHYCAVASRGCVVEQGGRKAKYIGSLRDISKGRQLEEALSVSEKQYRILVETMSDGLSTIDNKGIITYANKRLCEMTGYSADELFGHFVFNLMDKATENQFKKEMRKRRKGISSPYEMNLIKKDGSRLVVLVSPQVLKDAEGNIVGSFGVITDITKAREAEEALRKSEQNLKLAQEIARMGYWEWNISIDKVVLSQELKKIFGFNRSVENLSDILDAIYPDDVVKIQEAIMRPVKGEREVEFRVLSPEGEVRWLAAKSGSLTKQYDEKDWVFGYVIDITERKQAEEALRKSEQNLEHAQEIAHMGYWEWDVSTNKVEFSRKSQEMFGFSKGIVELSSILGIVHPDDTVKIQEGLGNPVKGNKEIEFRIITSHSDTRWIAAKSAPLVKGVNEGYRVFGYAIDITERKQTEERLLKSERNLTLAQEIAHLGHWEWDTSTNIVELSEEMQRILRSNQTTAFFSGSPKIVHPDDIVKFQEAIEEIQKDGNPVIEFRLVFPDDIRWVKAGATSIAINTDQGKKVFGYALDVTDQKQVEEALRDAQNKLRTVFDSIGDGVTVLDLAGNIIDVNDTVLGMKGYNREEVIGRFGLDFVAEQDRARATEEMMVFLSGSAGKTPWTEYSLLASNGKEVSCEASASLIRDGQGNPMGFISVERDITERKMAEQRLRESEEHYRMLVETSRYGIQENDISGLITFSNRAHHEILGYEEGELIGKYIWDMHPNDHEKEELKAYFDNLVSEQPFPTPAFSKNRTKDGRVLELQIDWNYRYDTEGQLIGFVSIVTDITEKKRSEYLLQESESLLKQAEKLAGIGSWQWNLQNSTFILSEGMRFLYGTEGKEFTHLKDIVETLVHPDDKGEVYEAAENVLDKGSGGTLIYRIIRSDGNVRWINATTPEVKSFGEDGEPMVMVGAIQDITERKLNEQRLMEREERWKLFSESATDVFTIWDSKLNLIDNSEKGIQAFFAPGTRKDDIVGKNIMEFLPDEEREGRYNNYLKVIKTGKPYLVDDIVPHHRFGDRHVSIKAFQVGEGLGTIVTDITEQKKAERQLRESEERLRAFMEASTDIYSIFDSQLRLIEVSDRGVKAFLPDKTREEQVGKHISEIVPEVMETGRYEEFLKVIKTGKPFSVEEAIIHPRYAIRHISIKAFKVQDGMGMIFSNITKRKKAEDELRHYSERLRAMTKQMSGLEESERRHIARELHDNIGQNLTVLGINFSRAKTQMTEGRIEEVQSILDDSQGLVEHTTETMRDIMANLRPPVLEDYGLLAALGWYGKRFALRTGIAISVQGEEPDPRLGVDIEIVLFRIAQEALINIAKHANANHVMVKYNEGDGKLHLLITDDGIGFDVADMSSSDKHSGWGMVTMSERAQSIGGSLYIESRSGRGTQIVVEVVR